MQTSIAEQVIIPAMAATDDDNVRWFSDNGCVVRRDDSLEVFIDGTLISCFHPTEVGVRNLLLIGLSQDRKIQKGKLAMAFGITAERLRLIRKLVASQGIDALPVKSGRGRTPLATPELRQRLDRMFASGLNAQQAYLKLGKQEGVGYRTMCRIRAAWAASREEGAPAPKPEQLALIDERKEAPRPLQPAAPEADEAPVAPDDDVLEVVVGTGAPHSGKRVQHVGGWLLLAMVYGLGLHREVLGRWDASTRWRERLRVAIDAVILALSVGQRCVEGVRRLKTPSGATLLRAERVPSASWTRRVLKKYVEEASAPWVQLSMLRSYLERSRAEGEAPAVFYVDNHLRPYTGKHTVRKGWRMQDKRVRAGITDYYVHDEEGRPVYRLDVPSHDSLTSWLSPVTRLLRAALGESQRILVAFDRAGAYPEQLARLRDERFEFVTYERRPYPLLSAAAFTEEVTVDNERIQVHESRAKNLGKGRGRLRRIALRMADGHQVNLLAISEEPAWRLIEVMLGRWIQENGFKHGNERWGINQLDRRKVEAYPPETVIPNPARRRLDHALRLSRHREGEARRQLARLEAGTSRRQKVERDLAEALAEQERLEAQRPHVPKRAPLEETELKDKLVYHDGDYKTLMDGIRIACANAESELAASLAFHLRKPAEAKKVLANLFAAPGDVRVNGRSITVTLSPAGNHNEQEAIKELFKHVNRWKLALPGDPRRRSLRFRSQL